jgi:glucose-1-phosphate thymidylyltransferase
MYLNQKIHIGEGTVLGEDVSLVAPVILGENCFLENCIVGPNVSVGTGVEIKGAKISNSIIFDNVSIDNDINIEDSLIGKGAKIIRKKQNDPKGHNMLIGDKTILEL